MVAYKDMSLEDFEALKAENNDFADEEDKFVLESEMTAAAIFGIEDPLRPGINEAVQTCHKAGITVVMCTGDNLETAKAISINAGILTPE